MADANRLEQVIVYLFANALKCTDAGGKISRLLSAHKGHVAVR